MKKIVFVITMFILSSTSFAGQTKCASAYAVGLGHFLKGEADTINEEYLKSEVVENEFHSLIFVQGELVITDKQTNKLVEMKDISNNPEIELYVSTDRLENHPTRWTGRAWGKPFLMVICGEDD